MKLIISQPQTFVPAPVRAEECEILTRTATEFTISWATTGGCWAFPHQQRVFCHFPIFNGKKHQAKGYSHTDQEHAVSPAWLMMRLNRWLLLPAYCDWDKCLALLGKTDFHSGNEYLVLPECITKVPTTSGLRNMGCPGEATCCSTTDVGTLTYQNSQKLRKWSLLCC